MSSNAENALAALKPKEGAADGTGEWFEVTQDLINSFADVTHDHQFIHVDPEAAKQLSPWGTTIAHGFLTLSLLTHLGASIPSDMPRLDGLLMGINYGFDKVRFINPVKVGSRIRASSVTQAIELKGDSVQITRTMTVEIEGEDKPALVADWINRLVFS